MKTIGIILALILTGCTHPHKKYKSADEFEENAKGEVDEIAFYANSQEFADLAISCDKLPLKSIERSQCLEDKLQVGMANVNIKYTNSDENKVRDKYLVSRDASLRYLKENPPDSIRDGYDNRKEDLLDTYYKMYIYESAARQSEAEEVAKSNYSEHVRAVSSYNEAIDQQNNSWGNIGSSFNESNTQNQINDLQRQQRQLQWQQQTGGRGIKPY